MIERRIQIAISLESAGLFNIYLSCMNNKKDLRWQDIYQDIYIKNQEAHIFFKKGEDVFCIKGIASVNNAELKNIFMKNGSQLKAFFDQCDFKTLLKDNENKLIESFQLKTKPFYNYMVLCLTLENIKSRKPKYTQNTFFKEYYTDINHFLRDREENKKNDPRVWSEENMNISFEKTEKLEKSHN